MYTPIYLLKYAYINSLRPDIDECIDENGGCSQTCTNTEGSFNCGCNIGYLQDGATCNGMDTNMSIYDWLCENQSFLSAIFYK